MRRFLERPGVPAGLVLTGSLALYGATAMRSPGWLDACLILSGAWEGRLGSYAINHNLYNLVGRAWLTLFGFLDPNAALGLLSALLGSLPVLLIYCAGRELTANRLASAIGAAGLAVSHSLWWHSTAVEVYALNTALIALVLFLVFRYFRAGGFGHLVAAYVAAGLGVFNHGLMALFVPALGVLALYLAARRPGIGWGRFALLALAYAAGCVPFAAVFLRDYATLAGGLLPFRADAFAVTFVGATVTRTFGGFFFPTGLSTGERLFWAGNYLFLLLWNFPSAAVGLAGWGLAKFVRSKERRGSLLFFVTAIAVQIVWSANYLIWEMYAFSLPVYLLLAVPLIVGVDALLASGRRVVAVPVLATLALPVLLYTGVAWQPGLHALLSRYTSLFRETAYVADLFDPARYVMNPAKPGYREAERYCTDLMSRLPPGSHFWDNDARAVYPLQFYHREILGRDLGFTLHPQYVVTVTPQSLREEAGDMLRALREGSPVFVSTLGYPVRGVLNELWFRLDFGAPEAEVASLPLPELRARAPFRVEELRLDPDRAWVVYRIALKE